MTTIVERTAITIVEALSDANGPLYTADLSEEILNRGGDPGYLHVAAKYLRDQGIMLRAVKARHMSYWSLASTPAEISAWVKRVRSEHMSELVSQARSLYNTGKAYRHDRDRVVANAIAAGVDLGMTPAEVMTLCEPLPGSVVVGP